MKNEKTTGNLKGYPPPFSPNTAGGDHLGLGLLFGKFGAGHEIHKSGAGNRWTIIVEAFSWKNIDILTDVFDFNGYNGFPGAPKPKQAPGRAQGRPQIPKFN